MRIVWLIISCLTVLVLVPVFCTCKPAAVEETLPEEGEGQPAECKTFSKHPGESAQVSLSAIVESDTVRLGETLNIQVTVKYVGPETPIRGVPVVTIWDQQGYSVRYWFIDSGGGLVAKRPGAYHIFEGDRFVFDISWDLTTGLGEEVPAGEYRMIPTIEAPYGSDSHWMLSATGQVSDIPITIEP